MCTVYNIFSFLFLPPSPATLSQIHNFFLLFLHMHAYTQINTQTQHPESTSVLLVCVCFGAAPLAWDNQLGAHPKLIFPLSASYFEDILFVQPERQPQGGRVGQAVAVLPFPPPPPICNSPAPPPPPGKCQTVFWSWFSTGVFSVPLVPFTPSG